MSSAAVAGRGAGVARRVLFAGLLLTAVAASAVLFCSVLTIGSEISAEPVTGGPCGENVTWSFDADTGVLTISGTGPMKDFEYNDDGKWGGNEVKAVVIEGGVTTIGKNAFRTAA